ncbi:hypothetical protein, partial [[Eubacterium] cellulosolvens]
MNRRIIISCFILLLLLLTAFLPSLATEAESIDKKKKIKDSDLDGIPDYLDNNSTTNNTNVSNLTKISQLESWGSSGGG